MPTNPDGYLYSLLALEASVIAVITWVMWHHRSGLLIGHNSPSRRVGFAFSHVLVALLAVDAMERRVSGPSFLASIPVVGRVATFLVPRLPLLVFLMSLLLLVCVALLPPIGQPGYINGFSRLWVPWITWSVTSSLLAVNKSSSSQWTDYLVSVSVLFACIMAMQRISAPIRLKVVRFGLQISAALSLGALIIDRNWAVTTVWTGGFLGPERLQGVFPQPNTAGAMFAVLLLITLLDRSDHKLFALFEISLAAAPLYLTGSRGAVLACCGALVAAWAFRSYPRIFKSALLVLSAGAVLVPVTLGASSVWLNGRATTWTVALEIWSNNPIVGGGAWPATEGGLPSALYAHNQLLQSLAETGVIGFFLLFGALKHSAQRVLATGTQIAASLMVMVIVQLYFENGFRIFTPQFVFPTVILIAAMGAGFRQDTARSVPERLSGKTALPVPQ